MTHQAQPFVAYSSPYMLYELLIMCNNYANMQHDIIDI